MTTSELITEYKNKLALKLVNTDGLVEAMGNDDIEEPDEAIYTYIFPYFHIPDTIEAAHSYICFKVNMTDRSNVNDWYENFTLTVWVIVNQALMKMNGHGGATRVDYLSGLVEKNYTAVQFLESNSLKSHPISRTIWIYTIVCEL